MNHKYSEPETKLRTTTRTTYKPILQTTQPLQINCHLELTNFEDRSTLTITINGTDQSKHCLPHKHDDQQTQSNIDTQPNHDTQPWHAIIMSTRHTHDESNHPRNQKKQVTSSRIQDTQHTIQITTQTRLNQINKIDNNISH